MIFVYDLIKIHLIIRYVHGLHYKHFIGIIMNKFTLININKVFKYDLAHICHTISLNLEWFI